MTAMTYDSLQSRCFDQHVLCKLASQGRTINSAVGLTLDATGRQQKLLRETTRSAPPAQEANQPFEVLVPEPRDV